MAEEAQPFLDALPERAAAQAPALPGAARAWSLQLPDSERELILVRTGIGLVAAASALATVLAQVRPSAVVSAGTTGGLSRQVEVGDVCASATLAYTDADATAFGYARGQTPGQPETFAGDAALLERLEQVGQEALRGATASSGSARLRVGQMLAGNSFVTAANVADLDLAAEPAGGSRRDDGAGADLSQDRRQCARGRHEPNAAAHEDELALAVGKLEGPGACGPRQGRRLGSRALGQGVQEGLGLLGHGAGDDDGCGTGATHAPSLQGVGGGRWGQ